MGPVVHINHVEAGPSASERRIALLYVAGMWVVRGVDRRVRGRSPREGARPTIRKPLLEEETLSNRRRATMAKKKKTSAAKKRSTAANATKLELVGEEISELREKLGDAVQRYNDLLEAAKVEA